MILGFIVIFENTQYGYDIPILTRKFKLFSLFFLEGKDRALCRLDVKELSTKWRHLVSSSRPQTVNAKSIEKIKNCHLFAYGKVCVSVSTLHLFSPRLSSRVSRLVSSLFGHNFIFYRSALTSS